MDFNLVINEKSDDDRINWCKDNLLPAKEQDEIKYAIDKNNRLIVYGNIVIYDDYEELPIKIDEVYGNVKLYNSINMTYGKFKSLKNFPDIIHGQLDISMNPKITSLKGCPKVIEGSLWCNNCGLTSLNGMPKEVYGDVKAYCNNISNIKALNKSFVNGIIDLYGNAIHLYDPEVKELKMKCQIKI